MNLEGTALTWRWSSWLRAIDIKKHKYKVFKEISKRLVEISKGQRGFIAFATVASIVGKFFPMGLMGFGAAFILCCAGSLQLQIPGFGEEQWQYVPSL